METLACIQARRSIRRYSDAPVRADLIEKLVDSARFAPSWANTKAIRYLCITDPSVKAAVARCADAANAGYIEQCPALFVLTGVLGRSGTDRAGGRYYHTPKEWLMMDAGLAAEALCLAAHDLGLGTLIMGSFDGDGITELLEIPGDQGLIALIAVGYPAEAPAAPRRKQVSEILTII